MVRRLLTVCLGVAVVVGAGALASCASPTLPLPPPAIPTMAAGADVDHIRLSSPCGGAEPDAIIVIVNENPSVAGDQAVSGSIAGPCGNWDANVFAHTSDRLEITQEVGTTASPPTTVQVR
jgi:hypothetical protein